MRIKVCKDMHTHTMIKGNSVDDIEFAEIILVRGIIAVPSYNIKGRMTLQRK